MVQQTSTATFHPTRDTNSRTNLQTVNIHRYRPVDIRAERASADVILMQLCRMLISAKKVGGTRTIAIAATLYRLLMQLDHEPIAQFEKDKAYINDSAKSGASALSAAEDRALEAELAQIQNKKTIFIRWDIAKFCDSIDIQILISLALECGFPKQQLALSLVIYHAPRRLELGTAIGDTFFGFGRSILAGCKLSANLARSYTVKIVN